MRSLSRAVPAVPRPRRRAARLGVPVLFGLVVLGAAATASAGGPRPEITVTKTVTGEAPPGARYRVRLECAGDDRDAEVVFGGPGSETVDAPCLRVRAVETETGGARSVTYSCVASGGARCVSDDTLELAGGGSGRTGSFTVTNSFGEPTTSSSTTSSSTTSSSTSTTSTTVGTTSTTAGTTSTTTSTTPATTGTVPGTVVAAPSGDDSNLGLILAIIAAIVFAAGAAATGVYLVKSRNRPVDDEGLGPGPDGSGR